ncbi:MAG TPA: glycosyltransferase [Nocardioides sp.]|nr:glycosyltransferase [Nocardioides sp.]
MDDTSRPRFSIVSAVYNVAPYLPEFIASLDAQLGGLEDTEILMVDDGSTDGSPALLAEWAQRRPGLVRVITQANAGQGAARNAGIAASRGEWITFPDPDDVLVPRYLEVVREFLDEHPDADLVATHRLIWNEKKGTISNSHPLRAMFDGSPYVDLSLSPDRFHGSSPASFFVLDRIRELGLAFDGRVRPNFEDGQFNCRYLLHHPGPRVGFLERAHYHYRKRADASSTLQTAAGHPGRYTDVLRHGYLDVARRAQEQYGAVPGWLATYLLYELHWYFAQTDPSAPAGRPTAGPLAEEFHELAAEILGTVDPERWLPYAAPSIHPMTRAVLAHGYATTAWREPEVLLSGVDTQQRTVRATYYFTGDLPEEVWLANGTPISPLHQKVRHWDFYGRTLLKERIAWLPATETLRLELDGVARDIRFGSRSVQTKVASPGQTRYWLSPDSSYGSLVPQHMRVRVPESREGRTAQKRYQRASVRKKYADAWVLMDRVHDANDSAEILFRYLRRRHPEINAWFVLEKGTPEWARFRAAGDADRLVAHGSLQWRLLMANAAHLLSSQADVAVTNPPQIREFVHPGWRFHFLQHGVIKDDISVWLNTKKLDTFVVSTQQELASIAGDGTSYIFTSREVALTGLPRFDRLLEVGERFPPEQRDLLLVAPTWRNNLLPAAVEGVQRRVVDRSLLDSELIRTWLDYLTSDKLAAVCAEHGVRIGFLPHPILQPLVPMMQLPPHVEALAYEGTEVQELFARARAVVTDYSSVAFNAAYLERPVVYYQFDADAVLGGEHVGRAGYFDYHRDGFGPVAATAGEALDATAEVLEHGPAPMPEYQERIDATFVERDGRCCERVVARVLSSERPHNDDEPTPTPTAP